MKQILNILRLKGKHKAKLVCPYKETGTLEQKDEKH